MTLSDPQPGFQGHGILTSRISQKRCVLWTNLLQNTNRKPCTVYRMIPLSMTLSDLWPHSKVTTFFEVEYRKNIVLNTKLLLHNRKVYLTYGMVLCLVTLTDLQTRRARLSASAELLVYSGINVRVILYRSVLDAGYAASAIAVFTVIVSWINHVLVDFDV